MNDQTHDPETEAQLDAITAILPPLLRGLETLNFAARHLHPPQLPQLMAQIGDADAPLKEALPAFDGLEWPDHLSGFKSLITESSCRVLEGFEGLRGAATDPNGVMLAYRSLRKATQATELLYPLASQLPPICQFFLESEARTNADLVKSYLAPKTNETVGVRHIENDRKQKGGYSIYVPENYDPGRKYPLVVTLHGGSGHGRDFLWVWLRAARTRGAILISPTSVGDTWSLMGPDVDSDNLQKIVDRVCADWSVDESRLLMTGMSDGGTFCYVSGLLPSSPFTHLAPISASFHPMLMEFVDRERVQGLPIYLTHGALDWMFPIDMAREANQAFGRMGADIVYSEIPDLSHTYPREENIKILDWLIESGL